MAQKTTIIGTLPINRGEYSDSKRYFKDNLVQVNGITYICKVDGPVVTNPEEDTANWGVFAGGGGGNGFGDIDIADIDLSPEELVKIANSSAPAYYRVKSGSKNVGTMQMFSDDGVHMVTQVLFTNYLLNDDDTLDTGTHSDESLFTYVRHYHISGGSSTLPNLTWGSWYNYLPDMGRYATKEELKNKQDTLVSGTNIKTINGVPIIGSGNIVIGGGGEGTSSGVVDGYTKKQIEEMFAGKAGDFYLDSANNRYLVFADAASRESYLEDNTQSELLLGIIKAGGGGGGAGSQRIEVTQTSPISTYVTVTSGSVGNYIDFTFRVLDESGAETGEPITCKYVFSNGGEQTITERYAAGRKVHFNIDKYLKPGQNEITYTLQGVSSLTTQVKYITVEVVKLSLVLNPDLSTTYNLATSDANIAIPFTISGTGTKTIEWYLDGAKIATNADTDIIASDTESRVKYITLSGLAEGVHDIQARAYTTLDNGDKFYSDTQYFEVIVYNAIDRETPRVAAAMSIPSTYGIVSEPKLYGLQQYVPYNLKFATFNPAASQIAVVVKLGTEVQATVLSENGKMNTITLSPSVSGTGTLTFEVGNYTYTYDTETEGSDLSISEIKDGLELDFRAIGRSNNDTDKDTWANGDYTGTLSGFNWNNASGWVENALLINAGASFGIDFAPLGNNPTNTGKTIEIEFASTNVNDDNAVLLDLRNDDGTGLLVTATTVSLTSMNGKIIETSYKDNEFIRVAFVIKKSAVDPDGYQLSFIYVNGEISRGCSWAATDRYTSNKQIEFKGTSGAEIKLKSLRIYNKPLTDDQVLNNYTIYRDTMAEMVEVYDRNNVYSGTVFDYDKMANRLPVMIVTGDIPTLEATTDKNEEIVVDIEYINKQNPERSFRLTNAAMRPQGTSSMGYPKKNFRFYTQRRDDTVLYDADGNIVGDRMYAFKPGSRPVNCWCLKADYAESSGTHNTGIAKLWNEVMINARIDGEYKLRTNAQAIALNQSSPYDVRTTIDGFPILMFYRATVNDPLIFIGKYNFNNDKSTEAVFGFCEIEGFDNSRMQCWEVLNNGNSFALFNTVSGFYDRIIIDNKEKEAWEGAFEGRYPDGSTETTDLYDFCSWMSSVSQSDFATQKWQHLDVYKIAAYYIYLMRFGAVDQTVKNAMFTSEDGVHFYYINYDNDTINGLINTGRLIVPWDATRTSIAPDGEPFYAGRDSRMWQMLENDEEFQSLLPIVDEALYAAGLSYSNVVNMFDYEQSDKWVERVYNQDAQYKYVGPYRGNENKNNGPDNLFMLQGSRSQHRKFWLAKRFSLFDSIYVTGSYKAAVVEFKFLNNTVSGQTFKITAGTNMNYGFTVTNGLSETGVSLSTGTERAFSINQAVNNGDPIRVYAAPHLEALDFSACADRLNVLNIANVYDPVLGTKLKRLVVGSASKINNALTDISGIGMATKLEYIDVQGMKQMQSLNLAAQMNIKTVKAKNSGVTSIPLADGCALQTLELPSAYTTLKLQNLPYLTTITSESNFQSVKIIEIANVPYFMSNFSFFYNWMKNNYENPDKLELTLTGVSWSNIDPAQLIELGNLGVHSFTGKAYITEATDEQITVLSSLYGQDCFNPGAAFQIIAPDGLFLTAPASVKSGTSFEVTAAIFAEYPGEVEWSITSGSSYASVTKLTSNTCRVATNEYTSSRSITLQAKHTPSAAGESGAQITYATATIQLEPVIRVTGGTVGGGSTIGSEGEYTFTPSPSNATEPYTVTWSLTGDAFTAGYVKIKSGTATNDSCTVEVTQKVSGSSFNIVATVNNGKTTFTSSKAVSIGVKFTLYISSNQQGDTTIANTKATVQYGSSSTTLGNGESIGMPANTAITVTFPSVTGYKTPDKYEYLIGSSDWSHTGTYKTEVVTLSLSADDGSSLNGVTVTIDGTQYTWAGSTISKKVPFDKSYSVVFGRWNGYMSPATQTFTANQVSRSVSGPFEKYPDGLVVIDQTISDPATMISGSVNSSVIQQIRANSHRYLGKYTAEGTMTLCQLDDTDSTKYADGSAAVLTGAEGDVFVKLPDFWYKALEVGTDIWGIQFHYGSTPSGEGWNKWDADTLIGAYEAYNTGSKVYSRSGVTSTGSVSQANFKAYARARGTGFQIVDWQMHCVMALLFYAQYGNTNCQAICGAGTNSSSKQCGQTNALGMEDTVAGGNGDSNSINFWGLENWWGNKYEWVEGIEFNNGIATITNPDGTTRTVQAYNITGYYPKSMVFGEFCDLIAKTSGGSATTGFCDYYYLSTSATARVVLRSYGYANTFGGVAYVDANNVSSYTNSYYGSRLAFRGVCLEAESVSAFKAATAIG